MIKWTPKSQNDLEEMMSYIGENFSLDLATEFIYGLVDYTESLLSKNPLAGKLLESNPLFSKLIYKENSIYYCENPNDRCLYIVYVQARKMKFNPGRLNEDEVA